MYLLNNIFNNLDLFLKSVTALFTGITALIIVQTYLRAKESIFQPYRQASLKRQIEIFEEILNDMPSHMLREPIEYIDTFKLNLQHLRSEDVSNQFKAMVLVEKNFGKVKQIYLAENLSSYKGRLDSYIINPFLPKSIATQLKKIQEDVDKNLKFIMPNFFNDLLKDDKINTNEYDLWNKFNHLRIMHETDFRKLRLEINKFLKINSMID